MGVLIRNTHLYTLSFTDDQVIIAQEEEDLSFMLRKLKEIYNEFIFKFYRVLFWQTFCSWTRNQTLVFNLANTLTTVLYYLKHKILFYTVNENFLNQLLELKNKCFIQTRSKSILHSFRSFFCFILFTFRSLFILPNGRFFQRYIFFIMKSVTLFPSSFKGLLLTNRMKR